MVTSFLANAFDLESLTMLRQCYAVTFKINSALDYSCLALLMRNKFDCSSIALALLILMTLSAACQRQSYKLRAFLSILITLFEQVEAVVLSQL